MYIMQQMDLMQLTDILLHHICIWQFIRETSGKLLNKVRSGLLSFYLCWKISKTRSENLFKWPHFKVQIHKLVTG